MQTLEYIVHTDFPSLNSRAYPICAVGCLLMKDKIGPDGFHSRNGIIKAWYVRAKGGGGPSLLCIQPLR